MSLYSILIKVYCYYLFNSFPTNVICYPLNTHMCMHTCTGTSTRTHAHVHMQAQHTLAGSLELWHAGRQTEHVCVFVRIPVTVNDGAKTLFWMWQSFGGEGGSMIQSSENHCVLISLTYCLPFLPGIPISSYISQCQNHPCLLLYLLSFDSHSFPYLLFLRIPSSFCFAIFPERCVVISLTCEDFVALNCQRMPLFSQKTVLHLGAHSSGCTSSTPTSLSMW